MIGPEWVQTIATGIPVYAASGLIVWGQGWLWRKWLWDRHGIELQQVAEQLGGPVRPRWAGWSVNGARGQLWVTGGLSGTRVRVRAGKRHLDRPAWVPPHEIAGFVADGQSV